MPNEVIAYVIITKRLRSPHDMPMQAETAGSGVAQTHS